MTKVLGGQLTIFRGIYHTVLYINIYKYKENQSHSRCPASAGKISELSKHTPSYLSVHRHQNFLATRSMLDHWQSIVFQQKAEGFNDSYNVNIARLPYLHWGHRHVTVGQLGQRWVDLEDHWSGGRWVRDGPGTVVGCSRACLRVRWREACRLEVCLGRCVENASYLPFRHLRKRRRQLFTFCLID